MATFNFCPNSQVPVTLPRDPTSVMTMNSWTFTAKPTTPYVRRYKVMLHGLRWYLNNVTGLYDAVTNVQINAKALEEFYEVHECWKPFDWKHPHKTGLISCRFHTPVTVPEALASSGGFIDPVEIQLIEHNPGY